MKEQELNEKIEYLMNKNQIKNVKELSMKSGIPYTTLRSILFDNVSNIRIDTAKYLANCLNVSLDYLTGNTTIENIKKVLEGGEEMEEIKLLNMKEVGILTGWAEGTVKKTFDNKEFPAIKIGKENQVEISALKQFFQIRRETRGE